MGAGPSKAKKAKAKAEEEAAKIEQHKAMMRKVAEAKGEAPKGDVKEVARKMSDQWARKGSLKDVRVHAALAAPEP